MIKALSAIEPAEGRPKWHLWLENWAARLGKDKVAKKPEETVQPTEK